MDFDEFRKKKQLEKEAKAAQKKREAAPTASGEKLDWVDGMGPSGPTNPKVKGFMLGRYTRKKVDPRTLERPAGYETTTHVPTEAPRKTKAEAELERKQKQLEKAQADLEALQEKQRLAEIAARREREGIGQIKGRQRY